MSQYYIKNQNYSIFIQTSGTVIHLLRNFELHYIHVLNRDYRENRNASEIDRKHEQPIESCR